MRNDRRDRQSRFAFVILRYPVTRLSRVRCPRQKLIFGDFVLLLAGSGSGFLVAAFVEPVVGVAVALLGDLVASVQRSKSTPSDV